MKLDLIQCTVRLSHDGDVSKTEILKSGPDAITPAEAVLLQQIHGIDETAEGTAIRNAIKVGEVELSREELFERMRLRYRKVNPAQLFPSANLIPKTLADLDLPPECLGKPRPEPEVTRLDKKAIRAMLEEAGVTVPKGNLSEDDLIALAEEAGLMQEVA